MEMNQLPPARAYAKVDDDIPVMVSITVPSGISSVQRKPVDLVVVLHVRSDWKVPKNCMKLLVEAVSIVAETLGDDDRLAILPVQPSLALVSAAESREAASALSTMILFGHGQDDKENRTGHIIVISNTSDVGVAPVESLLQPWRFPSVHAFSFRNFHNARTMHNIVASSCDCTYAILDDEHGNTTDAFRTTIRRITSSMPIEMKLVCEEKNVVLSSIQAPLVSYFISSDKKAITIWANAHPDPAANSVATTNYIVNIRNKGQATLFLDQVPNLLKVENVKNNNQLQSSLAENVVVAIHEDAMAEMVRLEAIKVADRISANDNQDWEQRHAAANELRGWWTMTRSNKLYAKVDWKAIAISRLAAEIQEMEIRLYNDYLWKEYMLSWLSHQRWQLPLPPLFIDRQATNDVPVQLEINAKRLGGTNLADQNRQKHGVAVLARVKVPETGLAKQKTPFVDLVVVLDVGCQAIEMEGKARERLQILSEATGVILDNLKHKDRLAIIPVQSSLTKNGASSLLEMSDQGREQTFTKIQSFINLVAKKSTKHAMQLKNTVKLARNCIHISSVNSSLPTPTFPASQHANSTTARSAPAAADGITCKLSKVLLTNAIQMLDNRPQEEKDRMGVIIVISDNHDNSICMEALSTNYNIHTFGFNGMHNVRAMYNIASRSNGMYDLLYDDRNLITEAFISCMNKITSIIVLGTEVDMICSSSRSPGVALSTIECGQFESFMIDNARKSTIMVGALHATSVKNFLFYMDNVREDDHDNIFKLFTVHVRCLPTPNTVDEKLNNQVEVIWNGIDGENNDDVVASIARVAAVKIITRITDPNYDQKLVGRLSREMETMQDIILRVMEKINGNLQYVERADPSYNEKLEQRLPWEMLLKVYEYKQAAEKVLRERKELAKTAQRRVFQHSKISNAHLEHPGYTTLMEESLTKELEEMEANLLREIFDPNYYIKLVDRLVRVLSPEGSGGSTRDAGMRHKLTLVIENMEANLSGLINGPTNNKQLVEQLVSNMCKSCSNHARAHGQVRLAMEMEKMNIRLGKEMVTMICRQIIVPVYYKNLMARSAMLTCLTDSESQRANGNALYALTIEKMEITLVMEMDKVEANPERMDKIVSTYNEKMVVLLVREMFLEVSKYAQVAGEARLSREMEDMEDSLVYKATTDTDYPDYYKKLVSNKLSYMLSLLSFQGSCEQLPR
uniref:VWFA domain-containing protein n=1 Tax=Oryza barthii TaxID=65489 RepID=A0A0D3FSY2_9ORYZ